MMKKRWAAAGLVGACAVCCAPLIAPLLAGVGLGGLAATGAGLLAGLPVDAIVCGALPLMALGGYAVWSRRRRKAAQAACACENACSTTACGTDGSSDARANAGCAAAPGR
jgi:uncharacterized membrane protein YedE/YeeE